MILTFYKPAKKLKRSARSLAPATDVDHAATLERAFDACLRNGEATFTSEAMFNRLLLELWQQRALGCLRLDRREFATRLRERGWTYDERGHRWERTGALPAAPAEPLLSLD
jgi:hypothetical protein